MKTWVGVRHLDGRVERVSASDGFSYQACVDPAGGAVAFAGARSGPPRVWRADLGTVTPPVALTPDDSGARHPVWTWAGDRIAFSSDCANAPASQTVDDISAQGTPTAGNIFTMGPDGSDMVQLTEGPFADQRPTYSPDGTVVVFVSNREGRIGLWRIAANEPGPPEPLPYPTNPR